jgi:drug/metabolite transporter (DMT)-like permease
MARADDSAGGQLPTAEPLPIPAGFASRARRRATEHAGTRNLLVLVLLALIWGSSFMFIKVGVRDFEPATLVLVRVGVAALALAVVVPFLVGRGATVPELRAHWRGIVVVGLVYTALPFWLLSWGETRIDSGLASIIQAAVPIFLAVLAFAFFHEQRVTGWRLVGIGVGFVGVALLVGAQPEAKILGAVAVVAMAVCYALGGLLTGHMLGDARPQVVALGTTAVAAVAWLPGGIAQAPDHLPGWKSTASVVVLGLVCTAVAFLLFFALMARAGAAYSSLVTYLVPPIALGYGALFLDERFGASAFGALALIFAGVALGTGAARPSRLLRRRGR